MLIWRVLLWRLCQMPHVVASSNQPRLLDVQGLHAKAGVLLMCRLVEDLLRFTDIVL